MFVLHSNFYRFNANLQFVVINSCNQQTYGTVYFQTELAAREYSL